MKRTDTVLLLALTAGAGSLAVGLSGCGELPANAQMGGPGMPTLPGGAGGAGIPAAPTPGAPAPGAQGQAAAGQQANISKPPGARPDPFKPTWEVPPPPITDLVSPIRVANFDTQDKNPEETVEIQEPTNRRVAGILTGNGIYALLETPGEQPQIVKPGSMVGDYRVESINSSSVTLKRTQGNQIITQVVPLTDAGSAPPAPRMNTGGGRTGGGFPAPGLGGGGGGGKMSIDK